MMLESRIHPALMQEHDMLTGFETKIYRKVRLFG
jgi:hypothetical protein